MMRVVSAFRFHAKDGTKLSFMEKLGRTKIMQLDCTSSHGDKIVFRIIRCLAFAPPQYMVLIQGEPSPPLYPSFTQAYRYCQGILVRISVKHHKETCPHCSQQQQDNDASKEEHSDVYLN